MVDRRDAGNGCDIFIEKRIELRDLPASKDLVQKLQEQSIDRGVHLSRFNDLLPKHPDFASIQLCTILHFGADDETSLVFQPELVDVRSEEISGGTLAS